MMIEKQLWLVSKGLCEELKHTRYEGACQGGRGKCEGPRGARGAWVTQPPGRRTLDFGSYVMISWVVRSSPVSDSVLSTESA